jgi:hypothetical protein
LRAISRPAIAPALAAIIAGLSGASAWATESATIPKVVLELFTSQGCSSCPPADKLLGDYAKRPDVLALSFNIDYWDYLGWKDTLASHDNSERQRAYAAARGDRQVYTPQLVVNGASDVVGNRSAEIDAAVAAAESAGLPVTVDLVQSDDAVSVKVGAAPSGGSRRGTIWLVLYDNSVAVPIRGGENGGSTVTYHNVVRKLRPIAMWKGEPMSIDLPKSELEHAKVERCAVLLQNETPAGLPGPILGAADIPYADRD